MAKTPDEVTVFVCKRGTQADPAMVKIQLEIPREVLESYKATAALAGTTAKLVMQMVLQGEAVKNG